MNHIKQTISGAKMILRCEKCGVQQVVEIKDRKSLDKNIELFEKDHKHPVREK